jgi:hypothetical protein
LIVVFASTKPKLLELEEQIASALEKRGIQVDVANAETEQAGVLSETVEMGGRITRIPLFKRRWKLPLLSQVSETTLARLRKDLSDYEVQEIYVTT